MNTPKAHDNGRVHDFLSGYFSAYELCGDYPALDDILSGVLELRTAGDASTRSLSRKTLFHVLQWCETINVDSINAATNGRYTYRSLAGYAAVARVASKAIERFIDRLQNDASADSVACARQAIDAPYADELSALVPWPESKSATYIKGPSAVSYR